MQVTAGMKGQASLTADASHSAKTFGVGTLSVVGLVALVALAERAAVNALRPHLDLSQDSIGEQVSLRQSAPVGLGKHVRAEAIVTAVDGNHVSFAVTMHDSRGPIAEGTLQRAIVDREDYLWGAAARGI